MTAQAVRYRTSIDRHNGRIVTGVEDLVQSLDMLWSTRPDTRVMLLDYGANLRGRLGEDITPALALGIYNDLVAATYLWEPEYRIDQLQFVRLTSDGALGLRHGGLYFPEGRLGNYDIAIPFNSVPRNLGLSQTEAA